VTYDHIVIETTGIAEPKAIRSNFHAAEDYGARRREEGKEGGGERTYSW
jgi:G3E family GTPase